MDAAKILHELTYAEGLPIRQICREMARWRSSPGTRSRWCRRRRGARIDAHHLGDVRPFVAGADTNLERFSWPHSGDPALSQHASVKEGITAPIRKFNEPEAFVRDEPLDDAVDGGPEGASNVWAKLGWGAESGGLRLVVVIVEFATPRMTEISMSHWVPKAVQWD